MRRETLIFDDSTFVRYPDTKRRSDRVYYIAINGKWIHRRLHDVLWEMANGPIPKGFHVHHVDENSSHNVLENLGCLSPNEHSIWHGIHMSEERRQASREHAAEIRDLAKAWHSSPEGRAWHSLNGKRGWENRIYVIKICKHCNKEFSTLKKGHSLFCSNNCKSAWRRASGIDNEDRICITCGKAFRVSRYSRIKHCSRSCGKHVR